jgi:hypothetical protein
MTLMAGGHGSGDAEGRCRYGGGDNYIKDRMHGNISGDAEGEVGWGNNDTERR